MSTTEAPIDTASAITRYEAGELTDVQTLELFAHLVTTGQLHGHYVRGAAALIGAGLILVDPSTGAATVNYDRVKED